MTALTAQSLAVTLHGLRLRGESHAADIIEALIAPPTDAQVEAALSAYAVHAELASSYAMRAALEAARGVRS